MKDWQAIFRTTEFGVQSKVDKLVLDFLAGGAMKLGIERVNIHWTDHAALRLAHQARSKNQHLIIGSHGAPSTLGMLTVLRDTIMAMVARLADPRLLPSKILWLAPKADMSQVFRRAVFSINGHLIPVRAASNLVSLDLLEQTPPTHTVAFLRDFYRVREALAAHRFATIVIDDPYGQYCNSGEATADVLRTFEQIPGRPPVVAIVPARAVPERGLLPAETATHLWPWTAELGQPDDDPEAFAAGSRQAMTGSLIQRSQIVFDTTRLLPAQVVLCPAPKLLSELMQQIWETSSRLAQEGIRLATGQERRAVNETRAAVRVMEALCMPVTIHEAAAAGTGRQRAATVTERLEHVQKLLFACSPGIRDDLSILLNRIREVLVLMKEKGGVPKWNALVALLKESLAEERKTAVAVPNLLAQEALLKALQVEFPAYKGKELPWEICTYSAVPRLGEVDELLFVGIPAARHNWLLRYPVCADRKLLAWDFHTDLAVWLAAPPLLVGAEEARMASFTTLTGLSVAELPDTTPCTVARVAVLEGDARAEAYYDIPVGGMPTPFAWSPSCEEAGDDDEDEEPEEQDEKGPPGSDENKGDRDLSGVTEHLVIHLTDGGVIYALNEDRFDVLKGRDVVDAAALSLDAGHRLLMIRGQSYMKLRNTLMVSADKKFASIWFDDDWAKWRQMCRQIPQKGKEFAAFVARLREMGCDKVEQNIRHWLTGEIMAPAELPDIRRMALAAGDDMMVYYSARFHSGMTDLRTRHQQFGKWLKKVITQSAKLDDNEYIDRDLDFTVGDLKGSVSQHEIRRVECRPGRPPHRTGEVIKRTGG